MRAIAPGALLLFLALPAAAAEAALADRLKSAKSISSYEYNWSLNDAK